MPGPATTYAEATRAGPANPDSAIPGRLAAIHRADRATSSPIAAATPTMRYGPKYHSRVETSVGGSRTPRRGTTPDGFLFAARRADAAPITQPQAAGPASPAPIAVAVSAAKARTPPMVIPMPA